MIKINITPIEELENRYWYLPDLTIFLAISIFTWYGATYYLETFDNKIIELNEKTANFNRNIKNLGKDLKRFDELSKKIKELEFKIVSLKSITVSKIARYKPIILLEHLQTLKPEGVWFKSISESSENEIIQIEGGAFDNLLISEFIAALESTKYQETDSTDIRTQVYFSETDLDHVKLGDATSGSNQNNSKNKIAQTEEEAEKIALEQKKQSILQKAFDDTQNKALYQPISPSINSQSSNMYGELRTFPHFVLRLAYKERNISTSTLEQGAAEK